eukprot:5793944-Prymnesium_polylepis.1
MYQGPARRWRATRTGVVCNRSCHSSKGHFCGHGLLAAAAGCHANSHSPLVRIPNVKLVHLGASDGFEVRLATWVSNRSCRSSGLLRV